MNDHAAPRSKRPKPRIVKALEWVLFSSRWLLAPFYLGLVLALGAMVWVFGVELWGELAYIPRMRPDDAIIMALSLIDLSLTSNLLLIVIYSGYENFVSRIEAAPNEDRPIWMGTVDFSGLKMKLIASIVAISAIALLKAFLQVTDGVINASKLGWMVGLHLVFVTSGVLMAVMDWINARSEAH